MRQKFRVHVKSVLEPSTLPDRAVNFARPSKNDENTHLHLEMLDTLVIQPFLLTPCLHSRSIHVPRYSFQRTSLHPYPLQLSSESVIPVRSHAQEYRQRRTLDTSLCTTLSGSA
jgi:hypothetical protein